MHIQVRSNAPDVQVNMNIGMHLKQEQSVAPGDVYVICHGSADDLIQAECDETFTYLSNGDDGFVL